MPNMSPPSRASLQQPSEVIIASQMGNYVDPFVSAIGLVKKGDNRKPPGDHYGTGGFILLNNARYLLTCEHVARGQGLGTIALAQYDAESAISVANTFSSELHPIDAAASPLSENSWSLVPNKAQCVSLNMLASSHSPVEGEYLYVYGFPGQESSAAFGAHNNRGLGIITHECAYDSILSKERPTIIKGYHIFLSYNPERASLISGPNAPLSSPPGMSGSFVWNTRYKEVTDKGSNWKPQDSRVTGLVWGHSTKAGLLIATPIQHIYPLLHTLG